MRGLLRRSAQTGLDWYFTSLALAMAPDETLLEHGMHFEVALRQLAVAGPMPVRPIPGLRRISDSHQLWELQSTIQWGLLWDCAFVEFPKGAPLEWHHLDECGRIWKNWGRVAADAHWSLIDTTDNLKALRIPDSHDSQAAVFLFALSRWLSATGRKSEWLNTTVWKMPPSDASVPQNDLTRLELMKLMIRHNLLNHMQSGLFRTFRHNRHPQGGQWDVQYLMDNIECRAALRALVPVFHEAGHTAFADVLRHYEQELNRALEELKSEQVAAPIDWKRWARQGDWPQSGANSGELAFYPHIASQYWEGLFESKPSEDLRRRWVQMEPHFGPYSDWWRHRFLHLGAGLPSYLARILHTPGANADISPTLLIHSRELTAENSLISDFVAAWRINKALATQNTEGQ